MPGSTEQKGQSMKNKSMKKMFQTGMLVMISMAFLGGCAPEEESPGSITGQLSAETEMSASAEAQTDTRLESNSSAGEEGQASSSEAVSSISELEVRFGDEGEPFRMQLEDNETAKAIARYVGTSDWRLPIYERDDDADYNVLQYYDISSRYDIPSNPETVTLEKAGEVYYSDPNRIVLFYQDAEISGEYTKIGTFDATDAFVAAVEDNPVLEGWGNKIVQIAQP